MALNNGIALPYAISHFGSCIGPAIEKLLTQTNGELNLDKRRAGRPGANARHEVHAVDPTCLQLGTSVVKGVCGVTLDLSQMMGPLVASVGGC